VHFCFAQILIKQIGWVVGTYIWGRFSISSDLMVEIIVVTYFNFIPALTPLQKIVQHTISACKNVEKYAILTLFSINCLTPILGRGYGAPPQTPPRGGI